ncbi:putative HVA22-like protein g isoform X2 [Brachypodium distachyon]|uniref:HVA22-like protein n=1 Tax=Brachypodium distachyon TaxID=15368 RepID=A0A0Q3HS66_BRADI|nr:putative HVA22-like protein g isoform X2 [Brachypodium distachyon]KQJ96354.1 hypothetical protein BRADI_3g22620v3 [Brachypodium distachyon]|eukprot:XP_024318251.1 putative HVA22-like protein g isoform X2 [Brachypodium distachyon]
MMGGFLSRVLLLAFGYAYPAYECYKTVELNKPEIEQLIFWCQYWILVALLTVLERFGDLTISWLPLYSEAKLMFFIYLWCPKTKGTTYVYETFFRPYISQHENDIDHNILELRARASDMLIIYWQKASTVGQTTFFQIMKYVAVQSPSQLSKSRPSQQSQPQKKQELQPQQQQQMPKNQPTTLRRAVSAAARQPATVEQSKDTRAAPTAPKTRRLTSSKSAPLTSTKSVASTTKLAEDVKTSTVKLAADETPATANHVDMPDDESSALAQAEAESDDMCIDEVDIPIEDTDELHASPDETRMEEAIRVTRSTLRRRIGTSTTGIPAADGSAVN